MSTRRTWCRLKLVAILTLSSRIYTGNWIEGGAFLIWHSKINEKGFPSGTAIFGSDNATGKTSCSTVSVQDNNVKWWRNYPNFSQRYSWTWANNNNTIFGKGESCEDGKDWKKDLDLTFTHVK